MRSLESYRRATSPSPTRFALENRRSHIEGKIAKCTTAIADGQPSKFLLLTSSLNLTELMSRSRLRSRALPGRSSAKGVALLMNAFGIYGNCWMGKQESPVQRLGSMSRRLHSRQRVGHM